MAHPEINDAAAKSLCEKLKKCGLEDGELELLNAAIKIARGVTSAQPSLDAEFDGCFKDGDAELIKAYLDAKSANGISKAAEAGISKGVSKSYGISKTTVTITKSIN